MKEATIQFDIGKSDNYPEITIKIYENESISEQIERYIKTAYQNGFVLIGNMMLPVTQIRSAQYQIKED